MEKIVKCDSAAFEKWSEIKNCFSEERAKENLQNIQQQPSNKKLYKKAFQMDNDSIETLEEGEECSIDTTSDIPETNTRMSNSSIDLIQLNPTTMTFNNNTEDIIHLPAIDHPCARQRLASRNNELEQTLTDNLQNYGTELILESIYTMDTID
ncbi:hypothetical protein J437_LFUL000145 [Ladona fulva]|uniref:Uncharacterized protein n=1 Tax=Ladona fulva TaxID=123851 RepID=A0A8K0KA94_LADFU|nr:hypothetical protein J437_LFUL000145 [Ladona fulva]